MFQVALPVAVVGFLGGVFRRYKYPECIDPDSDDEDSDDDDEIENHLKGDKVRRDSIVQKRGTVREIKEGKGKLNKKKHKHSDGEAKKEK